MDFYLNLILSVVLTAVIYMIFPLIKLWINHGKFDKKRAANIALWNSIVLGFLFFCLNSYLDGPVWNAAPAFFYYCINRWILTKKLVKQINEDNVESVYSVNDSFSEENKHNYDKNSQSDSGDDIKFVANILAKGIIEGEKAKKRNEKYQPTNDLDDDFGIVPEKPIYTVGIKEQEKYLKSLRTVNGEVIKWSRRGSMSVNGIHGIIDIYDIYLLSGEKYKTIYINMYGAKKSTIAPKGFSLIKTSISNNLLMQQSKNKIKGLFVSVISILLVIFVGVFVAYVINDNFQKKEEEIKLENQYQELKRMMLDVTQDNFDDLVLLVNQLPADYKNIEEIKKQCLYIQDNIDSIRSAEYTMTGSSIARVAYSELFLFDYNNSDTWNITPYLESLFKDDISIFVIGKRWENNGYEFFWYKISNEETLETNLPNDKTSDKKYYFFTKVTFEDIRNAHVSNMRTLTFGYENINNCEDNFFAYRIIDLRYVYTHWEIKVQCFSNDRIYTLSAMS